MSKQPVDRELTEDEKAAIEEFMYILEQMPSKKTKHTDDIDQTLARDTSLNWRSFIMNGAYIHPYNSNMTLSDLNDYFAAIFLDRQSTGERGQSEDTVN